MFLGSALSSAQSGLDSIERQLAIVGQNIANASTPNYARETVPLQSLESSAGPGGVRSGGAQRAMDTALQGSVFAAAAQQSGSDVVSAALSGIDQASGSPGSGQDLASQVGALQDSLSSLTSDPSNGSQQQDVLAKAGAVVGSVQGLAASIVQARQAAQDSLQTDVTTVNGSLRALGTLSRQIVAARSAGQSTAGLEDQRDAQMQSLSSLVGARFVPQSNGDVLVIAGNTVLPTTGDATPFSLGGVNFSGSTPPAAVPQLLMDGNPVSGMSGEMGAQLTLRDSTLPGMQSQLDTFAQTMASQLQTQGLPLFTDPGGAVPAAGTLGFSSTIQVSAAITANPAMLRDGTGPARQSGDSSLIQNVLSTVFSSATSGLPNQASSLVASYAGMASQAQAQATTDAAVVSGLQTRLSSVTGVSVDDELAKMVQLQAAYAANAKVITASQTMWNDLFGATP